MRKGPNYLVKPCSLFNFEPLTDFSISCSLTPDCHGSSYFSISCFLCLWCIVRFVDQRQCMACLETISQQDVHFRWWGEFTLHYLEQQLKKNQPAQQWNGEGLYIGNESFRGHGIHSFSKFISGLNELQYVRLKFRAVTFVFLSLTHLLKNYSIVTPLSAISWRKNVLLTQYSFSIVLWSWTLSLPKKLKPKQNWSPQYSFYLLSFVGIQLCVL